MKNIKISVLCSSKVEIYCEEKTIYGNNQQLILEQLEAVGIYVPFSCRAGVCEYCSIKLIKGEVIALKKSAINTDGTILCCSCLPKTSLILSLKFTI